MKSNKPQPETVVVSERSNASKTNAEFEAKMEAKFNGVFFVNGKKHLFSVTSLYCLGSESRLRTFCVNVICNKWFDRLITCCIIVNSCLLASKDYKENYDASHISDWNKVLD